MSYVAARRLKSKVGENKYVMRSPGEKMPEVEKYWPNPAIWMKRGFIKWVGDGAPPPEGVDRSKVAPNRAVTPTEIAEREEKIRKGTLSPSGFETTSHPEDGPDEFGSQQPSTEVATEVVTEVASSDPELAQLMKQGKKDLVEIAKGMDLPTRNRGKEDLARAILDARRAGA